MRPNLPTMLLHRLRSLVWHFIIKYIISGCYRIYGFLSDSGVDPLQAFNAPRLFRFFPPELASFCALDRTFDLHYLNIFRMLTIVSHFLSHKKKPKKFTLPPSGYVMKKWLVGVWFIDNIHKKRALNAKSIKYSELEWWLEIFDCVSQIFTEN